ncbi:hypothetical protein, partial [Escherichia coli]|uniref:hypothetical protein n=1 Tax=Escherichia coli TaxID=562 RepID=UPI00359447F9
MYFGRELRMPVEDSGAVGIIATDADVPAIRDSVAGTRAGWILSTSERDLQTRNDPRAFAPGQTVDASVDGDLMTVISENAGRS